MKIYRWISLSMAGVFASVGLMFLFFPKTPILFFNRISPALGFDPSPVEGLGFYIVLAVAYMYLVTLLALQMYRHPGEKIYAVLLAQGKTASSLLSLYLFLVQQPYLIFLANFLVDGMIGILVFVLMKKGRQ